MMAPLLYIYFVYKSAIPKFLFDSKNKEKSLFLYSFKQKFFFDMKKVCDAETDSQKKIGNIIHLILPFRYKIECFENKK